MYKICIYVNFMFQFEIKTDYPFTFQKNFFLKIPSFWVFTQASGKYPGKYPKNIYLPTGYLPIPHHYTWLIYFLNVRFFFFFFAKIYYFIENQ